MTSSLTNTPAWVTMLAICLSLFTLAKLVSLGRGPRRPSSRLWGYLFAWPGLDAAAFLDLRRRPQPVTPLDWLRGMAHVCAGVALVWLVVPHLLPRGPLLAGWLGFVGLLLLLHFGLFDLAASAWRTFGVDALPIMHNPMASHSLGAFWGKRWNRAFRDLAYPLLFAPMTRWLGPTGGVLAAFGVSGVVHELAISVPARGGFGGPTAYFLLQGIATLMEHSRFGRALGLGKGPRGWAFTMAIVLAPAPLLFHPPFIHNVIIPFLNALGAGGLHMNALTILILIGGLLHLGILIASATVPTLLDWRSELRPLQPLTRQIVWVHGGYIVGIIIAFAGVSLLMAPTLTSGDPLARVVCAFIALFWAVRLGVGVLLFDRRPLTATRALRWGERALTGVFAFLTATYGWVAAAS